MLVHYVLKMITIQIIRRAGDIMKKGFKVVVVLSLVVIAIVVCVAFFNPAKERHEVIASYKNDLGFTLMEIVERYNGNINRKSMGPYYEDYIISHKCIKKENVYENGIVETNFGLGEGGCISVWVYWDGKTKKVKEFTVGSASINKNDIDYYFAVVGNLIKVINAWDSFERASIVLESLDCYKRSFMNTSYGKSVSYGNYKYSLLTASNSSGDGPSMFITVSPLKK